MRWCRVGLAQINTTVGDLTGNVKKIESALVKAKQLNCSILAVPELAITGYPPEDLVLRRSFCLESVQATEALVPATKGVIAVVGFVDWTGSQAHNAAAVMADGVWCDTYHKMRLPNYGVFDEDRYFSAGRRVPVYRTPSFSFGVSICEDIWYPGRPLDAIALSGAELCININASPYRRGRLNDRRRLVATRASDNLIAIAYVNAVGGQDELVFDGGSFSFGADGQALHGGLQFEEDLLVVDVDLDRVAQRRLTDTRQRTEARGRDITKMVEVVPINFDPPRPQEGLQRQDPRPDMSVEEEVWTALVVGTRDYVHKTGFERVVVGLSGGVDSSVVATIAVDAVGADHVVGVSMPSRYSSEHSIEDAVELARNLGIQLLSVPIERAHAAMLDMLKAVIPGDLGVAAENLQSRQRGNVLMTLSNRNGWMVLTTGNKSEMATGYATLYGDMAGGFAVIKDVPKTFVYRIAHWRNDHAGRSIIPRRVLTKPPSAELRPGQLDQDSLPPYEILDRILEAYVEEDFTFSEIVALGFEPTVVRQVIGLVDRNEYKRRQAPPGVKITPRAFGRDRRYPLASRYRGA